MVSAVIFDFYGTLARFADTSVSNYETVLTAHGYRPERAVLDDYFSRYDGVEHGEHSRSEEAYESWVRLRLRDLTERLRRAGPPRRRPDRCVAGVGSGRHGAVSRGGGDLGVPA